MRQLYFRIILEVFAVLIIAFTFPDIIFRMKGPDDRGGGMPKVIAGAVELVRARLEQTEPSRQNQTLDSLSSLFDFPLQLIDPSEATFPAGQDPHDISVTRADHGMLGQGDRFSVLLANSGRVLVLGPTPPPPRPSAQQIAILVVLILAVAGIAGFLMIAPLVRDLRVLETAASQFGSGDFKSRAAVKSHGAVGIVARQFNRMAESIQKLIERERQLLQSVSHEMRTPIARIRFSLEMLRDAETRDDQQKRVREIDGEIGEVDQLVGELLDYNRIHAEGTSVARQIVPVRQLLEEVVQRLHGFRSGVEIEIRADTDERCEANADRILFRRAIENLVANALRFATEDIVIAYRREANSIVVEVSDDGPGIPETQKELIMRPFYRGEDRGNSGSGGAGLGLAIVQRIIDLHGGTIAIEQADTGGARFVTTWPD